jgi:hypothetical protein
MASPVLHVSFWPITSLAVIQQFDRDRWKADMTAAKRSIQFGPHPISLNFLHCSSVEQTDRLADVPRAFGANPLPCPRPSASRVLLGVHKCQSMKDAIFLLQVILTALFLIVDFNILKIGHSVTTLQIKSQMISPTLIAPGCRRESRGTRR